MKKLFYIFLLLFFLPIKVWAKFGVDTAAKTAGLPVSSQNVDLISVISSVVSTLLSFVGVIFLLIIIYGGFKWMMSKGDSKAYGEAKDMIVHAAIGLLIIFSAYILTSFVMSTVINLTK